MEKKTMNKKYGILEYQAPDWSAHKHYYKSIDLDDVGHDWFDCLNDDQQAYVQQMPKYSHLSYDEVIKAYDNEVIPNVIKKQKFLGWACDSQGNIIGFIK